MADAILAQSGIYSITNLVNGKRYIGQSGDITKRSREHLRALAGGKHHCVLLQRSFDKYGEHAFRHEVVELCARASITEREQFWMDHYRPRGIFNTAPAAGSPLGIKRSPESIAKMSAARKGLKPSEETRQKMRESQALAKDSKRAKALAQWARPGELEKISAVRKGRQVSASTRERLSAGLLDRWSDPEYKARVSASGKIAQGKLAGEASERMRSKWADPIFKEKMKLAHQEGKHRRAAKQ